MALGLNNGITPVSFVSTAGVNIQQVTSQATQLFSVALSNTSANPCFVKLYDSAAVTTVSGLVGAVPVANLIVPGNAAGAGSNLAIGGNQSQFAGIQFNNGLAYLITQNAAITDGSGIAAGAVTISIGYR